MKNIRFTCLFALFLSPLVISAQEGKKTDLEISSEVLKTADWAAFKYMENLDKAQSGDLKAIKAFLEFSSVVDGTESLQHAMTCVELIPLTTDEKMGASIATLKPKLKTVLLERFVLAQGRTKKEELKKPLLEWAPLTWKALNGEKVSCTSCMQSGGVTKAVPGGQKPSSGTTLQPAQPAQTDSETGKQ
jgi:hypothetical protein